MRLPEETLVFPAHDYKGDTVSSIGEEKRFNPRLQIRDADEYAKLMESLHLPIKMMDVAVSPTSTRAASGGCRAQGLGLFGRGRAAACSRRPDVTMITTCARRSRRRTDRRHSRFTACAIWRTSGQYREGGLIHELARSSQELILFYCAFGERSAMAVAGGARSRTSPAPGTSRRACPPGRRDH